MDYTVTCYQIVYLLLFFLYSPALVGAIPTQSQSQTLDGLAAIYQRSTDPPKAIKGTDLKLTSGWTFVAPEHGYWVNSIALWTDEIGTGGFIVVDGIKTINTKCLTVSETSDGSWLPNPLLPKGEPILFETQMPAVAPLVPDRCCLDYFSTTNCDASGPKKTICEGYLYHNAPIDIRSFKVYNCIGKWVPAGL